MRRQLGLLLDFIVVTTAAYATYIYILKLCHNITWLGENMLLVHWIYTLKGF